MAKQESFPEVQSLLLATHGCQESRRQACVLDKIVDSGVKSPEFKCKFSTHGTTLGKLCDSVSCSSLSLK